MQQQIHRVISGRIVISDQIVEPKRQIRHRADIERTPQRLRKQGVIVEVKRSPKAAAECDDSGEEEQKRLPGKDNTSVTKKATPPKQVPHPKNAVDRAGRVRRITKLLDEMYPAPKAPLHHSNAWELLVATILSAQCTDKRVNEVTPGLFKKYPTIADFANANQAELGQDIRSTGFFNNKSKALIGAAKRILTAFRGEVPQTMDDLLTVPGAARKTANVVLGMFFRIPAGVVVDTHVTRIARRLDLTKQTNPVKIEQDLIKILPKEKWIDFPLQLIFHGRAICFARKPLCAQCKLDPLCYAKDKSP